MPRFRFALEPLLELRRREEEARQRDLAELESQRRALEETLRERQRDISAGKQAMRDGLVGRVDPSLLRQQATATMGVDRLARRTVLELAGLSQRMEAARQRLVEASQRRRAVEILKERRLEEWNRELDRKETAFLDDCANAAAARKSIEERERVA
jgi:flagellar protein FliJ